MPKENVPHHHLPVNSYTIPTIYEDTPRGVVGRDLFSSLLKDNILFLGTPINDDVANLVCAKLLHLESENPDRDISLYINSTGW